MKLELFCILSTLGLALSSYACPPGWHVSSSVRGKCYFFSRDNATMPEAQEFCEIISKRYHRTGSLATIENAAVQLEISDVMNKTGVDSFWIGAEDIIVEGSFEWIGTGKTASYLNWGPYQPNNRWGSENCVCLRNLPDDGFDFSWTDDPCSDRYNFICEMSGLFGFSGIVG